jgi:queuine tRNA-ribosyltransferase
MAGLREAIAGHSLETFVAAFYARRQGAAIA